MALDAQKHHGMVQSFTPTHSPVMDTDDHFESFKSSTSNVSNHGNNLTKSKSSATSSTADFFAKRAPGNGGNNLNFLLNSNSTILGQEGEEEIIEISDDVHQS